MTTATSLQARLTAQHTEALTAARGVVAALDAGRSGPGLDIDSLLREVARTQAALDALAQVTA